MGGQLTHSELTSPLGLVYKGGGSAGRGQWRSITYSEWRPRDWTAFEEGIIRCNKDVDLPWAMGRIGRVWIPLHPSKTGAYCPLGLHVRAYSFPTVGACPYSSFQFHIQRLFLLNLCSLLSFSSSRFVSLRTVSAAVSSGGEPRLELLLKKEVNIQAWVRLRRVLIDRSESRFRHHPTYNPSPIPLILPLPRLSSPYPPTLPNDWRHLEEAKDCCAGLPFSRSVTPSPVSPSPFPFFSFPRRPPL